MSKKKQGIPLKAPSTTPEKYIEALIKAESGDTAPSETAGIDSGTASSLRSDIAYTKKIPKNIKIFSGLKATLGVLIAIGGIVGLIVVINNITEYFWNINNSLELTKSSLSRVENGLEKVEGGVRDLAAESRTQGQGIKESLIKVLEKFDRLFDNLQKGNNLPDSNPHK